MSLTFGLPSKVAAFDLRLPDAVGTASRSTNAANKPDGQSLFVASASLRVKIGTKSTLFHRRQARVPPSAELQLT